MPNCSLGFHTSCYLSNEEGLFFGHKDATQKGNIICTSFLRDFSYTLFFTEGVPYIDYNFVGQHDRRPLSELVPSLMEKGLYVTTKEKRDIFNWFLEQYETNLANIPERTPYVGFTEAEDGTLHVVRYGESTYALDSNLPVLNSIESRLAFLDLFERTADKLGFLIAMCYGLVSPLAKIVKSRNLFFPNLVVLGDPESGKSALLRFACSKIWGIKDNIKVPGDFDSKYASLKNLTGRGPALVLNDIDQENFDKMKRNILSSADETHGGSKGQRSLGLTQLEIERSFAISSNYLQLGTQEVVDRFFVYKMKSFKEDDADMKQQAEKWNELASKLTGIAYDIISTYEDYDVELLMRELFSGNRTKTKNGVMRLGMRMISIWLMDKFDVLMYMPADYFNYTESLGEDYISIFYSWVEQQYDEIKRKAMKDAAYNGATVERISNQYIMLSSRGDYYYVFPGAFDDFLRHHPNFPFKSKAQLAKRYGHIRDEARYYKIGDERKERKVLVVPVERPTDEEVEASRTWADEIADAMIKNVRDVYRKYATEINSGGTAEDALP